MNTQKKPVSVKLVGGLGNQLFCYFAGYDLATRTKSALELDVTDIRSGVSAHGSSIESFSLPGNFISADSNQFINRLTLKSFLMRVSRKLRFPRFFSKRILISKEIGFDARVIGMGPGSSLFGYFQTYRHFSPYKQELLDIGLRNPSSWFQENLQQIKSETAIAVHVRRGDYANFADTYGLLSSQYYKRAVEKIGEFLPEASYWVFSDDPDSANLLLRDFLPTTTRWIKPPEDHDAAETMLLMSRASGIVIANSTFSWWGAALNLDEGPVVAPSKWFKSMTDPKDLYPPAWITVESSWAE